MNSSRTISETPLGRFIALFVFAALVGAAMLSLGSININAQTSTPTPAPVTLNVKRTGHTATDLGNGKVLVFGGDADGAEATAEIVDVAKNTSTSLQILGAGFTRRNHTATKLSDGTVLIAGGSDSSGALNTTIIVDPTSGQVTSGPVLTSPRAGHAAVYFAETKNILFIGGDAGKSAEILDTVNKGIIPVTATMSAARSGHSAVIMNDGRVLIVGGNALNTAEIFDGSAFKATGNTMTVARSQALLRVLPDGKVQIIGGNNEDGGSMEVYDPKIDAIGAYAHVIPSTDYCLSLQTGVKSSPTRAALFRDGHSEAAFNRTGHATVELGSQALVTGGKSAGAATNTLTIFASSAATVTTDKLDYAPGELATISGRGFGANETINIVIHEDPKPSTDHIERKLTANTDTNGNFTVSYNVEQHDFTLRFILNARGQTSGRNAQTAFTDGNGTVTGIVRNSVDNSPIAGATVTCGITQGCNSLVTVTTNVAGQYTLNVTFAGNSGTIDVTASATGFASETKSVSFSANNQTRTADFALAPSCTPVNISTHPSSQTVTYGAASLMFTVSATGNPTPTVQWQQNTGSGFANIGGATDSTLTISNPSVSISGTQYRAVFSNTCNGTQTATSNAATLTVNKKTVSASFTADNKIYDGNTTATILTRTITPADIVGTDVVTLQGGTATFDTKNVGTGKTVAGTGFTLGGAQAGNYTLGTVATTTANIDPKTLTASIIGNPMKPYDGTAAATLTSANFSLTGLINGEFITVKATAGTYNSANVANANLVSATLAATDFEAVAPALLSNYVLPTSASGAGAITKATPTVTVSFGPSPITYDGQQHPATATVTGVGGNALAIPADGTVQINYTNGGNPLPPGAVPNYAATFHASANFTSANPNYNSASSTQAAELIINKADAVINVQGFTGPYDGNPHGATGTATGIGGVDLSSGFNLGATFTNVPGGTAAWTFSGGTNYNNQSGTAAIVINKANASIIVNGFDGTYDGQPHGATGTATGVKGENLSGLLNLGNSFTDVPGGSSSWSFAGNDNYNSGSGSVLIKINPATASCIVTGFNGVYDGAPHGASGSCTGVGGVGLIGLTVDPVTFINVPGGSVPWTFANNNYVSQSGLAQVVITKATATISVPDYTVEFDGQPHGLNGTANGVGGANLSGYLTFGAPVTNVPGGPITWSFDAGGNYNTANATSTVTITKAASTVTVDCTVGAPFIYTGSPIGPCTAQATGIGMTPVDVSPSLQYTNNTNAGPATAQASWDGDNNHTGSSGNGGFTIEKAASTTSVSCPVSVIFNGAAQKPCSATVTGDGGLSVQLTVSYTNNIGPGTATAAASYAGDTNHNGSSDSKNFQITNVPPSGMQLTSATISENGTATINGTFTDPDAGQSHTVTINWGDGSGTVPLTTLSPGVFTFSASKQFLDDNPTATPSDPLTVSVIVSDGAVPAVGSSTVTINNVAPTVTGVNGPSTPQALGSSMSITANYTDVGTLDTHKCDFNWDDSTTTSNVAASGGSCSSTKTFTAPGVYSVVVTVKDDDTGTDSRQMEQMFVVVFDPNGGFVTGGGWIMSPIGACQLTEACKTQTGKANFGFVSKYKKGSSIPEGQTEFQFHAGGLNFNSTSYSTGSLVVAGFQAQYRGVGTINGQPGYKFVLTAYDGNITGGGDVDKFRIKIMRESDGAVVYDNNIAASDDIDTAAPMAISGGSIVIHNPAKGGK